MSISIRRPNNDEIDEVDQIIKITIRNLSYYNDAAKKNELSKYGSIDLLKKIRVDPDSVFVADENNKIVGFCLTREDDTLIWLEWFGVIDSARRKGIGKKIINHLESIARKKGVHKIWCDCRTENLKSINLFSSVGYLPVCTLKNHWYGQDFIIWQKEII